MPKRSNDFQRLVKRIYDELAPFGAKVIESAMLQDVGGGEPSEIDVLVEVPVSGADSPFRMAVECRDHARPGDKTWIESLAGKYRDMPVDRIVAVSRRGFTRGARRKAGQCRIEIRTLAEALANDWPADLMHFSIDEVQHWPEIKEIKITADPPWPLGETAVGYRFGERSVDEREFGLWLCSEMVRLFSKEAQRQRRTGNSQFVKPGRYHFAAGTTCKTPIILISSSVGEHGVSEIEFEGFVRVVHEKVPARRYTFGGVGVTHASTTLDGGATEVIGVQERGKPLRIRITAKASTSSTSPRAGGGKQRRKREQSA